MGSPHGSQHSNRRPIDGHLAQSGQDVAEFRSGVVTLFSDQSVQNRHLHIFLGQSGEVGFSVVSERIKEASSDPRRQQLKRSLTATYEGL